MDFANRMIVVTGGTGALGRAVVGRLLAAGAQCRLSYLHDRELETFPYRDRVSIVGPCELTDEGDVARLYGGIDNLWGSVHIAGGFAMAGLAETGKDALLAMLNTNLVSCHLCCRAAAAAFAAGGRIVNVGARPGLEPRLGAGMAAYAASKAAVIALTQALAAELAPRDILVNAVVPSIIDTPANRTSMPNADHAAWPKPEQIAATIAFLVSPDNQVGTGAAIPVSGRS